MVQILKKVGIFLSFFLIHKPLFGVEKVIIMLDPAGSNSRGRKLTHGYERGATLMLAQVIHKELSLHKMFTPIITRNAGEKHQPLYTASFANRVSPKLVVHLSIFKYENPKPSLFIYYRCTNQLTNFCQHSYNQYDFIPLANSHVIHIKKSQQQAKVLKKALEDSDGEKLFDLYNPLGIPLMSLYGIIPPSLHLEIGVDDETKLAALGPKLAKALTVVTSY